MIRTDGPLEVGGVLSSGETAPLQLDSSKNLKVTGTATVSGTVTANQGTAGVSAWLVTDSTVETNTTPLVTSGGGGYVRQDSTATIAKETGGNLATVASLASALGGTVAPTKTVVVEGKTNDGTPQYQPIPEGAGGRSVIIEGYAGGTAVPVSLASAPSTSVTQGTSPWIVAGGGTAGTPGSAVLTVQGIASGTAQPVQTLHESALPWTALHVPATNTLATIAKSSGGGTVRNVCTMLTVTLTAGASAITAAAPLIVSLIDGVSGGSTYLWRSYINIPATAGVPATITMSNLWLVGSQATAMTLEFNTAGGTNSYESVSMSGTTLAS